MRESKKESFGEHTLRRRRVRLFECPGWFLKGVLVLRYYLTVVSMYACIFVGVFIM